ncbi:hypothetical protein [Aeromonas caviae]|uniref:hypothetical protein n=1 Tax=Aeromonas caviae TaxID=648 RepID=UPI0038D024ED
MDVICYLSNLPLSPITVTDNPDGSYIKNSIPLSAFGYSMMITQDMGVFRSNKNELRGQCVQTSQIFIKNLTSTDNLELNITMLTEMLSLATNSQVGFIGWKLVSGESLNAYPGKRQSIVGCYSAFKPPFCLIRSGQAVSFIESCWQTYSQLRLPRKINVAINLFTIPDARQLPLELKLATTFILLENLKASYADGVYPIKKNKYVNSEGRVLHYADLVKEMFEKVGMPETDTWTSLRNEIIHSGLCRLSPEDMYNQYSLCRDAITEYLLRLLGYQGEFFLYSGRGDTTKIITPPAPEPVGTSK